MAKRYTEEEKQFIKDNIGKMTYKEIADKLNVAAYARAYILPHSHEGRNINQEDIPQWIKDKIDNKLLEKNICK